MAVDPASLVALGALTTAEVQPSAAPEATAVVRSRAAVSRLLPESEAGRRRTAVLAGGSVAAGLLAGLLMPAAAQAQAPLPAAHSAAHSVALSVAAPSPFAGSEQATVRAVAPRPAVAPRTAVAPGSAAAFSAPVGVVAPVRRWADLDPLPPHWRGPAPVPKVVAAYRPTRPLPARSGSGRRIVYAERAAHLWIVAADGRVLRDYKVTGRVDRPKPGTYHVYSKSPTAVNPGERLTFDLMVRFAYGVTGARIGFHTIPRYYDGRPIQAEKDLGRAIGMGGCVRQSRVDARWLYAWSRVGDTVVVLH